MPIKTENIKFRCEIMGSVILTKNTSLKDGKPRISLIEGCSKSKECGVGEQYNKQKCEDKRGI